MPLPDEFWYDAGALLAVPVAEETYAYAVASTWSHWLVYPFVTKGGFAPKHLFGLKNWRWMVTSKWPPIQNHWTFAGILPEHSREHRKRPDKERPHYWRYEEGGKILTSGFKLHTNDELEDGRWISERGFTQDLSYLLLSNVQRLHRAETLEAFLLEHLSEMTVLERPFAQLIDAYEAVRALDAWFPVALQWRKLKFIEIWLPPDIRPPEGFDTFEDYVENILGETGIGGVGEFAEMDTYTFLSCDVERPDTAAKALLKAFKKAGYTTGIEIKERDGKKRVWKIE